MNSRIAKSTHTPGPWAVQSPYKNGGREIVGPHGEDIGYAHISDGLDDATFYPADANARLMAAAPDLLAACKSVAGVYADDTEDVPLFVRKARAAIAKAEGV